MLKKRTMLKKLVIVAMALASLPALAEVTVTKTTIGFEVGKANYNSINGNASTVKNTGTGAGFFVELNKNHVLSLHNITTQSNATSTSAYGSPASWQEAAYQYKMPTTIGTVYVKEVIGHHMSAGVRTLSHAEEVGMTFKLGNTGLFYTPHYRMVTPFDSAYQSVKAKQIRNTLAYAIDKNHTIYVRHISQNGYLDFQNVYIGYGYSF